MAIFGKKTVTITLDLCDLSILKDLIKDRWKESNASLAKYNNGDCESDFVKNTITAYQSYLRSLDEQVNAAVPHDD